MHSNDAKKRPLRSPRPAWRAALGLAACGSSGGGGGPRRNGRRRIGAAINSVVNPSDNKGGTLRFANSGDWDSLDPGDTYYAFQWNFVAPLRPLADDFQVRARPRRQPAGPGPRHEPGPGQRQRQDLDLQAQAQGVKFEDGTAVTSQDVKYAVERTSTRTTFPNGPSYFKLLLNDPNYTGPYKDKTANKMGLTAIKTPDDQARSSSI